MSRLRKTVIGCATRNGERLRGNGRRPIADKRFEPRNHSALSSWPKDRNPMA